QVRREGRIDVGRATASSAGVATTTAPAAGSRYVPFVNRWSAATTALSLMSLMSLLGGGCAADFDWRPRLVPDSDGAALVAAGREHSCILYQNGNVGCWGDNAAGQLGMEGVKELDRPRGVPLERDPVDLALGAYHSCARFADGTVACWGTDNGGFLGVTPPGCEPGDPTGSGCAVAPSPVAEIAGAVDLAAGGIKADGAPSDAVGFS